MRGATVRYQVARDWERTRLVGVLEARALQLWMRETLREMHKSPYLREGEWELMLAAYRECFPEDCPHCGGPKGHPPFDLCSP
jgi:hypothetical protein